MRPQGLSVKTLTDDLDERFRLTVEEYGNAHNHRYGVTLNGHRIFETDDLDEAEDRHHQAKEAYKDCLREVLRILQEGRHK